MELIFKEEYYKIVNAGIKVWQTLGFGFLEKVYENALAIELKKRDFKTEQQKPIKVHYEEEIVGDYYADILVNDEIILEIKTAKNIVSEHTAQLLNYLKGTNKRLGIILNFGPKKMEHKRYIL